MTQTLIDSRIDYYAMRSHERPVPRAAAGLQAAYRWPSGGRRPAPEKGVRPVRAQGCFVVPGGPQPRFSCADGVLIEPAPAYRMRGMYIVPREATAAATRPAGHFVGLCDGHTFCPMMR